MFKFVPDNIGGIGTKRKQAPKPCDTCKKRHKRCSHIEPAVSTALSPRQVAGRPPTSQQVPPDTESVEIQVQEPSNGAPQSPSKDPYLRFVGDLSPEASFLTGQRRSSATPISSRRGEIGVWLGQRSEVRHHLSDERQTTAADVSAHYTASKRNIGLTGLTSMAPRLRHECLSILPPASELANLMKIYFSKLNPIFPILQGEVIDSYEAQEMVALKQCVCLAAAPDPKARDYLQLPHVEKLLSPVEFRSQLAAAVKQSLDMSFIENKVVLLQICALMGFYADEANCSEVSSSYVSQAVHHAHTLGVHLGWPEDKKLMAKSKRLFGCIWVIDRLNAATNGRPVLMHQQDIDDKMLASLSEQEPPFRLLIRITQVLDGVISQYRPHATAPASSAAEHATFENLVQETGASHIGGSLLATLEVLYLAVVILRNRPSQQDRKAPSSELQLFAAQNIIAMTAGDFNASLTFWPPIPYAVSLATSVAYQTLRNSVLPYHRKMAYSLFNRSCEVLEEMGKAFSSARVIARLATNTVQEMERIAADWDKARRAKRMSQMPSGSHSTAHTTQTSSTPVSASPLRGEIFEDSTDRTLVPNFDPADQNELNDSTMPIEAPSFFDDLVGDAAIFDDFDPSLDLARIDQVFSANLDPTNPLSLQDWWGQFLDG